MGKTEAVGHSVPVLLYSPQIPNADWPGNEPVTPRAGRG